MGRKFKIGDRVRYIVDGREPYPGRIGTILPGKGRGVRGDFAFVKFGDGRGQLFRLDTLEVVSSNQSKEKP